MNSNQQHKDIVIGNQNWMSENLSITDEGLGKDHWKNPNNGEVYYTWEAAKRLAKKVPGYHIPTNEEWKEACEDSKLKEKLGIALVGFRGTDFYQVNSIGYYWSSSEFAHNNSWYLAFYESSFPYIPKYVADKTVGYPVRLIKNQQL